MRVAIRVDASVEMGTGHLKRCLALAHALSERGASLTIVSRRLDDTAVRVLTHEPFPVIWLRPPTSGEFDGLFEKVPRHAGWAQVAWNTDAVESAAALRAWAPDWVFVDHYSFDARWHAQISKDLACLMAVMDDLGDRSVAAEFLVDQNWSQDYRQKYSGHVSAETGLLGGPRFALLGEAYQAPRKYAFSQAVRSIGIFMGGTDPAGASETVLTICREQNGFRGVIEVASTSANPRLGALVQVCRAWPETSLLVDQPDLADFFARHDLQIGAGGGATWERCRVGAPMLAVTLAENQAVVVEALAEMGVLRSAVLSGDGSAGEASFSAAVSELLQDGAARLEMSSKAAALVDGRGAERIALRVLRDGLRVRPAERSDAELLHAWRNHPDIRAVSLEPAEIPIADHVNWFESALEDRRRTILVGMIGGQAVGCIRFDRVDNKMAEVSLYLDPALQGLGLGGYLLRAGELYFTSHEGREFTLTATVLAGNTSSQKMFSRAGFSGGPLIYSKPSSLPLQGRKGL